MIIVNMNEGAKVPYEESGCRITFDDDLTINLTKREQDWADHIDVCYDEDRNLVLGATAGRTYVAQIDIPPRQYTDEDVNEESQRVPVPLDMDTVTLSLWAVN